MREVSAISLIGVGGLLATLGLSIPGLIWGMGGLAIYSSAHTSLEDKFRVVCIAIILAGALIPAWLQISGSTLP